MAVGVHCIMISKKGKRKIIFRGQTFYWYIKKDEVGYPCVFVFSEDKRLRLKAPLIDSEAIGGPVDAADLLKVHFGARG